MMPLICFLLGGIGKVILGADLNDSQTLFSYNENYEAPGVDLSIPVMLLLVNSTAGDYDSDVSGRVCSA